MITYYRNLDLHWWQFIKRAYRRNLYDKMNRAYWATVQAELNSDTPEDWYALSEDIAEICTEIENGMGGYRHITVR